jgi:hypothetical protein
MADGSQSAGPGRVRASGSRRQFISGAAAVCGTASAALASDRPAERVLINGVDRFRVRGAMFEGVRIVVNHLGEKYTPAYIQGISGGAFRIAGICPCAANCSLQMDTKALIKLLGYECTESILGWTGDVEDAQRNMVTLIPRIKEALRTGKPVLLWYGFADSSYEVVTGYDDTDSSFLGRHMWQGAKDAPARAKQTRAQEAAKYFPAFGALFVGAKTGKLDAPAAEIAALREAVRHAHDPTVVLNRGGTPPRQGLVCYQQWVDDFRSAEKKRGPGDSVCQLVYSSTHRAAGQFTREIARRYPRAARHLMAASREFAAEADALDEAGPLVSWQSPEHDAARNARVWPILDRARGHYAAAIAAIEQALPAMG